MVPRVVLAACLALGSALCGKALSDAARRRANTLLALTEGLRLLRIHMTDMMEDIQTALMGVNCPLLGAVGEGMRSGVSVDDAWRAVRSISGRRGPAEALLDTDLRTLDRLFSRLGRSGRAEQEALLDTAEQAVESQLREARDKAGEAERLYTSIGLLVGLMLALIVI